MRISATAKPKKTQKGAILGYIKTRKTGATMEQVATAATRAGFPNEASAARRVRELVQEGNIARMTTSKGNIYMRELYRW